MKYIYLHGFASGPGSTKARFFLERFRQLGLELQIPQLDQDRFENLTITSQREVVDRIAGDERSCLLGSSLGGWIASLYAARHSAVQRLVLMAPGFGFPSLYASQLGDEEVARWQREGFRQQYHYSMGREVPLRYSFLKDAQQFEDFPDCPQPALIFHGTKDATVPVEASRRYVQMHPNATLVELDSGHELTDVLEELWGEAVRWLKPLEL